MRKIKKNFNLILLLFFVHVSIFGLKKFTLDEKIFNNITVSYNKEKIYQKKDGKLKHLIKKQKEIEEIKDETLNIANYKNPDFFSDVIIDETSLNLTLVPVESK